MPYANALSIHPLATHAVGESVGQLLETIGVEPDLVVLFAGDAHTGALDDIVGAVRRLLRPRVLIGCTTATVVGGDREIEDGGGLSLWAARGVGARAHRLHARRATEGVAISGFPRGSDLPEDASAILLLADPFSFPVEHLLEELRAQSPQLPVVGGMTSAGRGPGGSRLVIDDDVFTEGAIALALAGSAVTAVVSQGCRPVGAPMIVTKGEGTLVHELAGQPALQRVQDVLRDLSAEEIELARSGLLLGCVVDESKPTFGRGDFVISRVLGADAVAGAVAIGDHVDVGSTVQLQLRDATTADEDLRALMAGQRAAGALMFTCTDRGTRLFGMPHHDASVITHALGGAPLAGMSCAGEIGPVGGRSFLHGRSASVALFRS